MPNDPWDPSAFGLTPVAAGKASAASAAPAPAAPPGRAVSMPGASGDPWDPSAFGLQAVAAAPTAAPSSGPAATAQPVAAAPTRDGMTANIAAGGNEAIATNAGAPADLVAGALNLIPRGINAVAGTHLPTIQDPVGGSAWIKRNVLSSVGANPDDVVAATPEQRMARAMSGGAVSALLPGGAVAGLGRAGLIAAETVPAVMGITGGMTPSNAALGAVSGLGADQAAQAVPDAYKPLAGAVGGLLAGGGVAAGAAGLRSAGNSLGDIAGAAGIGRRNALADAAGSPIMGSDGAPLRATDQQAIAAGRKIEANATDPGAVRQSLAQEAPPLVEGSNPTSFQLTGDQGLGQLERGVSRAPEASAQFQTRAAEQNAARVGAIGNLAPADASPAEIGTNFRQQLDAMTNAQAQRETALATDAQQKTAAVGGAVPTGDDQQATALQGFGQAMRGSAEDGTGLAGRNAAAKANESRLWSAIDPDRSLGVDMSPVRTRAAEIQDAMGPNAKPIAGEEAAILDAAGNGAKVQGFRDLADLRSRITDALPEMRKAGDNQGVRRMSALLDSVHDAMSGAVMDQAGQDAAAVAGGHMGLETTMQDRINQLPQEQGVAQASAPGAPSVGDTAYTPSGAPVGVRYGVREADDITASQLPGGQTNPAYPAELQPRDRTRAASADQVNRIAQKLNPERLGASASTAEGAPIVGPDGMVESGNGRTLAIKQAYAEGGPQADAYRAWLASQGHDVAGMKAPILVRERTSPVADGADRAKLADNMGSSPVMAVSASERAAADSRRLPADALSQWRGGDVTDARNADFIRSFAQHAVPESEQAGFMTSAGQMSQEGADRVRNAMVQRAYGSNSLVSAMAEHADDNIKAFGGAMMDAAGNMAKLRAAIETGAVPKSSDLAPALVEAANLIQTARRAKISLPDAVAQRDAFAQHGEFTESILRAAYGDNLQGRMSRAKLSDLLGYYADEAQMQSGLFGANRSTGEMLAQADEKYGYGTKARSSGSSGPVSYGPGVGQNGNQARGPVDGATGAGDAAAGGGAAPATTAAAATAATPSLEANFDAAAAGRYQAARAATAERHDTFTNAPGVGAVLKPGRTAGDFKLDDSRVPAAIFNGGPGSAERVQAFLRAGGSQPELSGALKSYAAFDLRRAAENADGTLDPAKFAKWSAGHAEAMSAFPELQQKFSSAAEASNTLAEATAANKASREDFQKSAAGQFLGDADPVRKVGDILGSNTAQAQMADLAARTASTPDARAGLQRAVVEHMLTNFQGNKLAGNTGTTQLSGEKLQTFIRQKSAPLSEIFTPEQMTGMQKIAADIQRSDRSVSGNRMLDGSPTVENALAAGNAGARSLLSTFIDKVAAPIGSGVGAYAGSILGIGPVTGSVVGGAMGSAVTGLRSAGIGRVDQLVTEAMLNPALMRTLLTHVDAASRPAALRTLGMQMGRIASLSAGQGVTAQRRGTVPSGNAPPGNALAGLPSAGTMRMAPRNALLMTGVGR